MPAIGVTQTAIAPNAVGEIILSGRLIGVDTTGLTAGNTVYVNGDGTLTDTKPTGSALIQNIGTAVKINATEGEILILGSGRTNDLPNLTTGYGWFGNTNHVPIAQSTASFAKTDKDNTFTGTQIFNNISVSGTGSFGYLEAVTGSAKIIGDAFIILNNDTPSQRYAGIKVIDSGSTQATASLQFDGQTNDWFYEYTSSGDPDNFGIILFGPEYNTIGNPTYPTANTIQKGNGGHHLLDSNITDNGSTITLNSNTVVSGSIQVQEGNPVSATQFEAFEAVITPILESSTGTVTIGNNTVVSGSLTLEPNRPIEATQVQANESVVTPLLESSTGTITIESSTVISGSVATKVASQGITSQTASIDFSNTSLFELTLANGADTHIDATNIGRGQTINVLITQNATGAGTVSFSPKFLQPSGSEYTATTTLSGQDILTLITYSDTSNIYVVATNKFE